jgi:hypothetical protein
MRHQATRGPSGVRGTSLARVALAVVLASVACSLVTDPDVGEVEIRIANESAFTFNRVDVGFPAERVSYGALAPNESSSYRRVEHAYRYAYVEIEVDGEEHILQPIDYVGETPLSRGKYTYRLDLEATGAFSLTLRRD